MPYEKPVVRDYGDVAEVTASVIIGDGQGTDDVTQKSSDLGVIK